MRETTSLGITLAPPHEVIRASPILASTGSFSTYPTRNFATLGIVVTRPFNGRGVVISVLPRSARRHADRTISSSCSRRSGVWPLRIPRFRLELRSWSFLLIVRTPQILTLTEASVLRDTRMFQHLARFDNGHRAVAPAVHRYSYGRH
jgi:hypothetical protein